MRQTVRIGVLTTEFFFSDAILIAEDNRSLLGTVGLIYHGFVSRIFANITYVYVPGFGVRFPNGSVSEALKLLDEGRLDLWFMPEAYDQYSDRIAHTAAVDTRKLFIGHPFDNRTKEVDVVSFVQNFQFNVAIFCVLAVVSSLYLLQQRLQQTWLVALQQTGSRVFFLLQMLLNHPTQRSWHQLLPRRTFFLVPISLAVFALASALQSLIKTEKVSMDNSFLLLTLEDVLRSDYWLIWMPVDRTTDLFLNARDDTIYRRIWMKKGEYVDKTVEGTTRMLQCDKNCIGFHNLLYLRITFTWGCTQFEMRNFFISPYPFAEEVTSLYTNSAFKAFFMERAANKMKIENALVPHIMGLIQDVFKAPDRCIYESLEDVRRDYVPTVDQVDLSKFYRLFVLHFVLLQSVHLLFWLHTLASWRRKHKSTL